MPSALADERGTIPRRHLKDRHTAPRLQVIGFDLSATAAGKSGRALDYDDDDGFGVNCMHAYSSASSTPMSTNINTDTSPRSALQQLLLPHSDAIPAFPAHNTVSHGPSFLAPAAKQMTVEMAEQMTVEMAALTSKPCTMVGRIPTMPVNWPASKGIAELITGPSLRSTSIHDRHRDCSPAMAVGKVHSAMRIGSRSCQPVISAHSGENERNWDANNRPPEESKKSIGMEVDKSKKTSLFILSASSPIVECGNQCFHGDGADQYKSSGVDMEFLNSCHLCKRFLGQGHDIFMYSRDKAFCSMDCRYQQMLMDERKERRTPLVIRAGASPAYRSYMASPTGNVIIDQTGATTPISIS